MIGLSREDRALRQMLIRPLALGLGAALVTRVIVATRTTDFDTALLISLMEWTPWIVVAPLVLWFAGRVPIGPHHFRASLAHVPAGAAAVALHLAIGAGLGWIVLALGWLHVPGATGATAPAANGLPEAAHLLPRYLRAHTLVPIYIALVASARAAVHYRERLEREQRALQAEAKLAEARLMALQMQLQPHFLFNTLHTISSLVYTQPKAADEAICELSELLRAVIDASHLREVTLARELRFAGIYLRLQQRRLNERLKWTCEIEAGAREAMVPIFLLQPLIENAVQHGVAARTAPGYVDVNVVRQNSRVQIRIANSGSWTDRRDAEAAAGRRGIGISNTRARLAAVYGGDFDLAIDPGDGEVSVTISIPLRTAP